RPAPRRRRHLDRLSRRPAAAAGPGRQLRPHGARARRVVPGRDTWRRRAGEPAGRPVIARGERRPAGVRRRRGGLCRRIVGGERSRRAARPVGLGRLQLAPAPEGCAAAVVRQTRRVVEQLTVATGDLATADMVLNIGPQHPATHGVLRLTLTLDGERIVRADPVIGYMHRGAEKLFEARDYRQILVLANRHDWLSSFSNELGIVL